MDFSGTRIEALTEQIDTLAQRLEYADLHPEWMTESELNATYADYHESCETLALLQSER